MHSAALDRINGRPNRLINKEVPGVNASYSHCKATHTHSAETSVDLCVVWAGCYMNRLIEVNIAQNSAVTQVMESSYPLRPGEPDCRDYLRTGRCKYGESCKYNHPTNVEVGGGVKPTNPGEPMFPVRPGEPPCQYFLKHGTCKFGQSCKFDHSSGPGLGGMQGAGNAGLPSGLVFLSSNNNASTYAVDSNGGLRHSGSVGEVASLASNNVQILPQRPNEQNCIYFLRNGRCKYGPTCKFHHPIETATAVDRRRSNSFSGYGQNLRLQPITEQTRASQKATHILLPDGQIAVIIDPSSLQQVNEGNIQPQLYMSADGSLQTMQSLDQSQISSPVLTATTTSSATVASSFQSESTINMDSLLGSKMLSGRSSQGSNCVDRQGYGSGSNLSAYNSDESIPSASQAQHILNTHGQINSAQRQPWSIEINQSQQYQHEVNVGPNPYQSYGYEELGRGRAASAGHYYEASNPYLNGSLSLSAQIAQDQRVTSHYGQTQPKNQLPAGNGHQRGESADGLTEMTSHLLTMMDRHVSDEAKSASSQNLSPGPDQSINRTPQNPYHNNRVHYSQSEPTFYNGGQANSPARPRSPPGMSLQRSYRSGSIDEINKNNKSPGGSYMQPSMSSMWGGEKAPRF